MRWADGYIAVDWGTTNRRAYKIDASGACVDEFEDGQGVLSVRKGEFPSAAAEIRARLGDLPMLLAGMAGSNRGWVDAPYVPCPAGVDELVRNFVWASDCDAPNRTVAQASAHIRSIYSSPPGRDNFSRELSVIRDPRRPDLQVRRTSGSGRAAAITGIPAPPETCRRERLRHRRQASDR